MPYLGKLLHDSPASLAFVPWKLGFFPQYFQFRGAVLATDYALRQIAS